MKELPRTVMTSRSGRRGFELKPEVLNDRSDIVAFLRTRRSAEPIAIAPPGPDEEQLGIILECAARTPDHGKLEPWRFIVIRGDAREHLAEFLLKRWKEINPGQEPDKTVQHDLVRQAPVVVVVVARTADHPKIPVWEQQLSVGACCMNLIAAATAMEFAAQWRSGWLAEDPEVFRKLGLQDNETIAGVMFIGSRNPSAPPQEDRRRPFWQDLTTYWQPGD